MAVSSCKACSRKAIVTPQTIENRPRLSKLNYRVGDYTIFKNAMLCSISEELDLKNWKVRLDTDFGMAIVSLWAYLADILTFYQERIANEAFLRTALHRDNVIRMAAMLDYKLNPGAAATTYMAIFLEKNLKVNIPIGLKVQSIPGQDEEPQKFETVESVEAFASLNEMFLQVTETQRLLKRQKQLVFKGVNTGLEVGDYILLVGEDRRENPGSEHWDLRKLSSVEDDSKTNTTTVRWEEGLGHWRINFPTEEEKVEVFAMKHIAWPFGVNAPEWCPQLVYLFSLDAKRYKSSLTKNKVDRKLKEAFRDNGLPLSKNAVISVINVIKWKIKDVIDGTVSEYIIELTEDGKQLSVLRRKYNIDWTDKTLPEDEENPNQIFLDQIYDTIKPDSWIVLVTSEPPRQKPKYPGYSELYKVNSVDNTVRINYTLNSKVTRLTVDGIKEDDGLIWPEHIKYFPMQGTMILAQSDPLELAEVPIQTSLSGKELIFEKYYSELKSDRILIIKGILDDANRGGKEVIEVVEVDEAKPSSDSTRTIVTLKKDLENSYKLDTVQVYGNVVKATHGETVTDEVLGSGDSSSKFQEFTLKKSPTTFVPAANAPRGVMNTLEVRVGDVLWKEVESLYGQSPNNQVYITRVSDDGKMSVRFGDGITGSRLPTSPNNVVAKYRQGLGVEGNVRANTLKTLLNKPVGAKSAINPKQAEGGTDPESLKDARKNAPNTVRTFEKAISLRDYEDLARNYTGIAKAKAITKIGDKKEIIQLTIAGENGVRIETTSLIYQNFIDYLDLHRDINHMINVVPHSNKALELKVIIQVDPKYIERKVLSNARTALLDYFSFDNMELGQGIHLSNIYGILQETEGITAAKIEYLRYKVENNYNQGEDTTYTYAISELIKKGHILIGPKQIATLKGDDLNLSSDFTQRRG